MKRMNPNDVRIGNIVEWDDDSHEQVRVETIECNRFNGEITNYFFNGGLCDDFIGIPITEEWLVKLGFRKLKRHGKYGYIYAIGVTDYTLNVEKDWEPNSSHFFGVEYTDSPFPKDENVTYNFAYEVKYVHELQNLYFSITRQELNII